MTHIRLILIPALVVVETTEEPPPVDFDAEGDEVSTVALRPLAKCWPQLAPKRVAVGGRR